MRTEKDLQGYFIKKCKESGMLADKLESKSRKGWPDVIVIHKRLIYFVEFKHPNGRGSLSVNQVDVIRDIRSQGGRVLVIDTMHECNELIEHLKKAPGQ